MMGDAAPPGSPSAAGRSMSGRLFSEGRSPSARDALSMAAPQGETLESVQAQVQALQEECQMYETHVAAIDAEGGLDGNSAAEEACTRLANEEQILRRQLSALNAEKEGYDAKQVELEKEAAELASLEQQYWHEYNAFTSQREAFEQERDSVAACCARLAEQDDHLRNTNVYNDSFFIWHEGSFGTINKFRLGRLPNQQVDWSEINAAWGQVVLLLHTMVTQKQFSFSNHELFPMGSFSKIREGTTVMELYGGNSWFSSFDRWVCATYHLLPTYLPTYLPPTTYQLLRGGGAGAGAVGSALSPDISEDGVLSPDLSLSLSLSLSRRPGI
eukprot:SAG22_NODE_216_length_14937_cov_51.622995_3_plen_329_part_00